MSGTSWHDMVLAAKLPKSVADAIIGLGYDEQAVFQSAFSDRGALDAWLAKSREKLGEDAMKVDAADWATCPLVARLRLLWSQSSGSAGESANAPACLSLVPAVGSGVRLDTAEREKLRKTFEANYPGTVLHGASLPCVSFLSVVKNQCSARAWEWVPWKKGLSEDDAVAVKSRKSKSLDFLDIMSHAAGLGQDEWDMELSNAPLRVSAILIVRAHAYSMCGAGHLSSWMQYVQKFMHHYTKPPSEGFRLPTALEAEQADREVMGEVFRMVFGGIGMDRALLSVVKDDLLRLHLSCRPKPLKPVKTLPGGKASGEASKPPTGTEQPLKRKRPAVRPASGKKFRTGYCFDFQEGRCSRGDECRFKHVCEKCGGTDHGAAACKQ